MILETARIYRMKYKDENEGPSTEVTKWKTRERIIEHKWYQI